MSVWEKKVIHLSGRFENLRANRAGKMSVIEIISNLSPSPNQLSQNFKMSNQDVLFSFFFSQLQSAQFAMGVFT